MRRSRVLVVDDAPEVRRLVSDIIDDFGNGWQVVATAADGERAIQSAQDEQPDVVLLDISMPVMDGLEALPHIRQAAPHAVIVILTGYPRDVAEGSAKASGAHGFIEKQDIAGDLVPQMERIVAETEDSG